MKSSVKIIKRKQAADTIDLKQPRVKKRPSSQGVFSTVAQDIHKSGKQWKETCGGLI